MKFVNKISNGMISGRRSDNECEEKNDQNEPASLLICMLCTLKTSKIHPNSKITVVIYNDGKTKLPLYKYKELFKIAK